MITKQAQIHEAEEITALVNSAYRGESSRFGWTTEADYLDGSRTSAQTVREMIQPLAGKTMLTLRDQETGPIIGCVYLEKMAVAGAPGCYLGMLTINPKMQDRGYGRILLDQAEIFARDWGASRMTLGVVQLRGTLMAWYERRGYKRTEVIKPFPYDDPECGTPKRQDLHFIEFEKDLI